MGNRALDLGIPIYPIVTNYRHHIMFMFPRNQFRMHQFASLGKMTGGQTSEYASIDAPTLRKILESVKSHGLSEYVVGFVPPSSDQTRVHNLSIRLAPSVKGTLEGGKRRAVY